MKPTERIIELAKRLHELGYSRKILIDDLVYIHIWDECRRITGVDYKDRLVTLGRENIHDREDCTLIPSLSDALDFLNENVDYPFPQLVPTDDGRWICSYNLENFIAVEDKQEACLEAMVKVLEGK